MMSSTAAESSSHQSSSMDHRPPRSQHEVVEDEVATDRPSSRTLSRSRLTSAATACFLLVAVVCTQQHASASSLFHSLLRKSDISDQHPSHNSELYPWGKHRPVQEASNLRRLEDGGDQDGGDQDGGGQEGGDQEDAEQAAVDDEGEQQDDDEKNSREREPGNDDFFDDFIQDDLIGADSTMYDDFYVFERGDHHRTPKLFPLQTPSIVGFFCAALVLCLGASSGTGGGGTIVPIYILIIGLPIQVAIPIGAVTVLGGALASTSFNWTRRHPLADRVLIDWDLVLVMEPLTLVGTLLGTLFHRLVSEKILVVLLVLLLSMTAHSTLSKAMRMYQAELRYIRHLRAAQSEPHIGSSPSSITKTETWGAASDSDHIAGAPPNKRGQLDAAEKQAILILNPDFVTLRSELMQQEKFTPRSKIIALCCMFSVLIFLNIMVGGGAYESPWDIVCGSVAFWVVHVIMIAFLIASAWMAHSYVVARFEIKQLVRFDYVHGDIKWDTRSAIIYPVVFVTAGIFAGTLGIGGGIITVPIMLAMGVHPGVVSATSSTMILFTTFASSISFFVFGLVLLDFAIVGFLVGIVAASLGQILMRQARQARSASGRDFERNSYTAFAIGGVILISALLMTIEYVFTIVEQPDDQGGLCDGLRF